MCVQGGKEIAQDSSVPDSSVPGSLFLVYFLFSKDQQTAVPRGAVPLRQPGTTHGLWEDRAETPARGEEEGREMIMNGQIHPDLCDL